MIKIIKDPSICHTAKEMESIVFNTKAEKGFYRMVDYINVLERENAKLKNIIKDMEHAHGQVRK